jgi:folate-binding protein YgfZ
MRMTPLEGSVRDHGAVLGEDAGAVVPASYGDVAGEAAAVREAAGVADVSHWGTLRLAGKNSVKFLQGLVSNDVAALAPGTGCFAAFLNTHGRVEAVAHIFALGENSLALRTPPESTEWVVASLGRFRLAGGFDLTTRDDAAVTIQGPGALDALGAALGVAIDGPFASRWLEVPFAGVALDLFGVARTEFDGADVVGPVEAVAELLDRLVTSGDRPARIVGTEALEVLRVEAGLPRIGRDFDADSVLLEIDVPEVVSFTKGCYLGQEIVARLHYQGQPAKLVRRLVVEGDVVPAAGDAVVAADDEAKVAGRVTSAVASAAYGPLALGIVKRRYYAEGTQLLIRHGDALLPATVAARGPAARLQEAR